MSATPIRHIRVPDEEWQEWAVKADRGELSVSAWVRAMCNNAPDRCVRHERAGEISEVSTNHDGSVTAELIIEEDP